MRLRGKELPWRIAGCREVDRVALLSRVQRLGGVPHLPARVFLTSIRRGIDAAWANITVKPCNDKSIHQTEAISTVRVGKAVYK